MQNEAVFEGFICEKPELFTTEKNLKIVTVLVGQQETFESGNDKTNVVPFKAFRLHAEELMKAGKGDLIQVTSKLSGRSYKDKNGKTWYQSDNVIKSLKLEKTKKAPATIEAALFDDIPF